MSNFQPFGNLWKLCNDSSHPLDAAIFPEYIIPAIAHLVRDSDVLVRCMYAQVIVPLADTAVRYLEMGQALKAHGTYKALPDAQEYDEAHFEVRPLRLSRPRIFAQSGS